MATSPIQVDLPHSLGAEEAKRRMDGGLDKLKSFIPGATSVRSAWNGDRLGLQVEAMGQEVNAHIDVHETFVRVELNLPPALAFFRGVIEGALKRKGGKMLEDRSAKS